jgi:hypothetical protein
MLLAFGVILNTLRGKIFPLKVLSDLLIEGIVILLLQ